MSVGPGVVLSVSDWRICYRVCEEGHKKVVQLRVKERGTDGHQGTPGKESATKILDRKVTGPRLR